MDKKMKQKYLFSVIASCTIFSISAYASEYPTSIPPAPLQAIETTPTTPASTTTTTASTKKGSYSETMGGYLGIGIDVLPNAVAAQMPTSVSAGQGIIVTRFAKNSPAEKNGLKVNDILLAYDDTKIVHPQQFINLIRDDKPGRDVKITLLRNSKIITQNITLGMQKITPKSDIPANYTGLAIKKIGENTFDASIGVPTQNGGIQRRSFKGTRVQIFQQVSNATDLPAEQRNQLLFALQGGNQQNNNGYWNNMMPFGNNNRNGFFPFGNNNGGNFFPFGNNNGGGFFPFGNNNGGNFFPFGNNNGGGFPFNNGFNNGFNTGSNGGNFFPFNNNGNNSYFPNMFGSKH